MTDAEYRLLYCFTYLVLTLSLLDRLRRPLIRFFIYRVHKKRYKRYKRKSSFQNSKKVRK